MYECVNHLVSDEQAGTLGAVLHSVLVVEVLFPLGTSAKRLQVHEVEHDEAKVGARVVHASHEQVSLLTANVPELKQERVLARRRGHASGAELNFELCH